MNDKHYLENITLIAFICPDIPFEVRYDETEEALEARFAYDDNTPWNWTDIETLESTVIALQQMIERLKPLKYSNE